MLKRVIFAPEKKELRVESYTRCSMETNWAAAPHFVVLRAAGRGISRKIGRAQRSIPTPTLEALSVGC
jgi:hypothetical protein